MIVLLVCLSPRSVGVAHFSLSIYLEARFLLGTVHFRAMMISRGFC